MVGAVHCSVFLAEEKPKSRRNVELLPVVVQSSTAVFKLFHTLYNILCVCACVCVIERVCSDAIVLCQ